MKIICKFMFEMVDPHNDEIVLYEPWRPKFFFNLKSS